MKVKEKNFFLLSKHQAEWLTVNIASSLPGIKDKLWNECRCRFKDPWDFPSKSTGVGCHCLLPYESIHFLLKNSYLLLSDLNRYLQLHSLSFGLQYQLFKKTHFLKIGGKEGNKKKEKSENYGT